MKYFIVKYHYTIKGTATNTMDSEQIVDEVLVNVKDAFEAHRKVSSNYNCIIMNIKKIKLLK